VGAAGLAATLVAAFWAGRLTHDDLPDLEVEAISPQDARAPGGGYESWPTLGNRKDDVGHAKKALRTWLTARWHEGDRFGEVEPSVVRGEDRVHGDVIFSGTVPNGGRIPSDRSGDHRDEHVTVVHVTTRVPWMRDVLVVYNPDRGEKAAGNQERSIASAPWDSRMMSPGTARFAAPIPLLWLKTLKPASDEYLGDKISMVVPPWLTNLRVAGFEKDDSAWRPLRVNDDGTASVPIYKGVTVPKAEQQKGEQSRCSNGVLLRADEKGKDGGTRQVTYVYRPGFPFPVTLSYDPARRTAAEQAQILDRPEMRYAAGALLCDSSPAFVQPADSRSARAPFEVVWRPMWEGRPHAGAPRMAVVAEDISFASAGDSSAHADRTRVVALGVDDPRDRRELADRPHVDGPTDDGRSEPSAFRGTSDVGCLIDDDHVAVFGPKNSRQVRLVHLPSGRVWSKSGNFASFPRDELPEQIGTSLGDLPPGQLPEVQAVAVTDDEKHRLHSMPCINQ